MPGTLPRPMHILTHHFDDSAVPKSRLFARHIKMDRVGSEGNYSLKAR